MTSAQYRKAWDRLYVQSMQAGSEAESDRIQRKLNELNAEYYGTKSLYSTAHHLYPKGT